MDDVIYILEYLNIPYIIDQGYVQLDLPRSYKVIWDPLFTVWMTHFLDKGVVGNILIGFQRNAGMNV